MDIANKIDSFETLNNIQRKISSSKEDLKKKPRYFDERTSVLK